ncbi:MAG TPA: flagellar hook-basal body complex protein FliE [Phycisphaerales bacterium]|nr:flagellar hook-basal body complex protein FliE [Phycisphaerales bacterium]
MVDPLGLVSSSQASQLQGLRQAQPGGAGQAGGPSFKDVLMDNLRQVNDLQNDANTAIEDLHTHKRDDIETVLMATAKADTAFKMLQQLRNKVMDAYEEIKQIRV